MDRVILEFKNISKQFPGVKALDNVSFNLNAGEVHVVVGENGAGKSTLMKILSGAYEADSGEIIFEGETIVKNSPNISESLGIQMIYQELNLIPDLSIASNIYLGHELKKGPFVLKKVQENNTEKLLCDMGIQVNPKTLVKNLGVGTQQMVEITKALSQNAKLIVFDEPTSSLTDSEIKELFRIICILKERGVGMFYISHRLEEMFEIGDRVTVLRDGQHIMTADVENTDMDLIVEKIAGRKIENRYPHIRSNVGEPKLEIKNLTGEKFRNVNMTVNAGEIVGVAGLIGAGRTEVARAVFGIDQYSSGEVYVNKRKLPKKNPQKSSRLGMCLLPEDRKIEGLALNLSIRENMTISSLKLIHSRGIANKDREKKETIKYIDKLNIATNSIEKYARFLSGGTQQKVVIARWLMSQSNVFIFDEPTRGIDVGAKSSIYELMDNLVKEGAAILMISSDMPEILGMSDRIYVMSGGEVVSEFDASESSQNEILSLAFSNV